MRHAAMRKNTELSCYLRGIAFFDERYVDGASRRQKADVAKNLQMMAQFDMLVMRPLIEYGRIAYTELRLEDKLGKMLNDFDKKNPLGRKEPSRGVVVPGGVPSGVAGGSGILL